MGLHKEAATWERVEGLRVHSPTRSLELTFPDLDSWPAYGLVKPRRDLDRIVLSHAEEAGAKVLYHTQVTEPIFERGVCTGIRAKRDGLEEDVRAKWVVCAEGSATKFTRTLGRTRDPGYPMGFAIRQYFRSPLQSSGWFEAYLGVRARSDAIPAYGWVFPVGDGTVNVGVGLLSTYGRWKEVNLHDLRDHFVSVLPSEWEINDDTMCSKPRAGRLFMGSSVWPPHGPGFLIAGDAAGMINPCNGEGIAYAYETGRKAGRHIDEALRDGSSPVLGSYTRDLIDSYGSYYRLGRRFVKVIGNPFIMDKLVSLGMRSRALMSFTLTMLGNLEDERASDNQQRIFKFLKLLAEVKP